MMERDIATVTIMIRYHVVKCLTHHVPLSEIQMLHSQQQQKVISTDICDTLATALIHATSVHAAKMLQHIGKSHTVQTGSGHMSH